MSLIELSVKRPVFITMVELFLIVLGLIGLSKIGVDLYPKIDPPVITVSTEYPGAGPSEIETQVTKPIEEEVNQIGSIERLVSTSRENISQVVIEFDLSVDPKAIQIEVQNKVARIKSKLPKDTKEPLVQRLDLDDPPVMTVAVRNRISDDKPTTTGKPHRDAPLALIRRIADQVIKPRLQQVDGVGQIDLFGGLDREVSVDLDAGKLELWKVRPNEVAAAIGATNVNVPSGELVEEPRRRSLRVIGEFQTIDEVISTIVKTLPGGHILTVGDLATVRDTFKDPESLARYDGKPVVLLEMKRQSGANTVQVVNGIKDRLNDINKVIPNEMEVVSVFDGSKLIRMSIYDVFETFVIAAVLAFIVVYLFLGSVQSTVITGIALPATCITSIFALYMFGFTLNTMTMLALTLCVGLILDDAIVVRENIWRKIEEGMHPREAAIVGAQEVMTAVVATSLTVVATFLPVAFIPGTVGRMLSSFAFTVCLAVGLSLFDAVTMAPMLSAFMSPKAHNPEKPSRPNFVLRFCEHIGGICSRVYLHVLDVCMKHTRTVLATAFLGFFVSLGCLAVLGFSFLPATEYGELLIGIETPVGSSIIKTNDVLSAVEMTINGRSGVETTSVKIGTYLGDRNVAQVFVRLVPEKKRDFTTGEFKKRLREALAGITLRENLLLTVQDASGWRSDQRQISLAVQGPELERLSDISHGFLEHARSEIPEALNLVSNLRPGRREVQILMNRGRAAAFGLSTEDVGNAVRTMFEGDIASELRDQGEEFDIRVRLKPDDRVNSERLRFLTIPNNTGAPVPLSAFSEIQSGVSPANIVRINQIRAGLIEGDVSEGISLEDTTRKLEALVQGYITHGYEYNFQGQARFMRELKAGSISALALGALFIYMIMASLYESLVLPIGILLTLPLAAMGALLALFVSGALLDLYAVIGIILLMGLVTKNAILLIDYTEQLRLGGMPRDEAIVHACQRRLRPIMMTTVAMIAGMLPVALGMGELNRARSGMGIAAVGGLVSSTVLSLLVIPCAYIHLDQLRVWAKSLWRRDEDEDTAADKVIVGGE